MPEGQWCGLSRFGEFRNPVAWLIWVASPGGVLKKVCRKGKVVTLVGSGNSARGFLNQLRSYSCPSGKPLFPNNSQGQATQPSHTKRLRSFQGHLRSHPRSSGEPVFLNNSRIGKPSQSHKRITELHEPAKVTSWLLGLTCVFEQLHTQLCHTEGPRRFQGHILAIQAPFFL